MHPLSTLLYQLSRSGSGWIANWPAGGHIDDVELRCWNRHGTALYGREEHLDGIKRREFIKGMAGAGSLALALASLKRKNRFRAQPEEFRHPASGTSA